MGFARSLLISLPSFLAALGVAMTLRDPERQAIGKQDDEYWRCIVGAARFLGRQPALRSVILLGTAIAAVLIYADEFWQVYLARVRVPVIWFGPFLTAVSLICGVAGALAYRAKKRFACRTLFPAAALVLGGALLAAGCLRSRPGVFFLLPAYLAASAAEPLVAGYLHHRVDSAHRATVESFQALALRLTSALAGLIFGWAAERWSIFAGYVLLGAGVAACGIWFALTAPQR